MFAQEGAIDYLPFVEKLKSWEVVRTTLGQDKIDYISYVWYGSEEIGGKNYNNVKAFNGRTELESYFLREENRKVYMYDTDNNFEFLVFDYSLKEGDTYETYSYDESKMVTYKVLSVGEFKDGPEVIRYGYDEVADTITISRRYLQKWTVSRIDDVSYQKIWIESAGSLEGPLANLYDSHPYSIRDYLIFVDQNYAEINFAFPFYDTMNNIWRGQSLPHSKDMWDGESRQHKLTYELEGDRLHIYGQVFTIYGGGLYILFKEEQTDDPQTIRIRWQYRHYGVSIEQEGFLFTTDFYVPGFDPNKNYIVVDNKGEEHPVINKTPQTAYLPFVEEGKVWRTFASHLSSKGNKVKGYFSGEEIKGGKTYSVMYSQKENDTPLKVGLYREENKKVYEYNEESGTEYVIYDFSLKVGDEFTSTIPFVRRFRVESEGEKVVNGYHLRTLRLISEDPDYNYGLYWIEGLGGEDGPFGGLYSERPGSQRADIAYVQYGKQSNFAYLPFIFNDINHEWQGAPAFLSEEKYDTHEDAGLKYEVVGCRLHVYGYLWASPGSSNYLFFKEEETGTPMSHVFRVEREFTDIFEGAVVGLYYVDLYTRDCGVYYNYKVVDEFGEHDVVNRNFEYHPFIEENKVWKVGYADAGNPVQFVEYYYFDGDTIIDGKTSKKMMCMQVANDGPWCYDGRYSASEPLKYCGAFYEQDRKVYYAANDSSKYKVIYDFSITGDEYYDDVNVGINGHSFHVGPRRTEGMNTFKGIYMNLSNQNVWMEGVGSDIAPIYPVHYGDENRIMFLMSCTVGDEVIYLNEEYEDGTIPEGEEAKKRRFDFNHTVKTQPKTPLRRGEETALYGEYNNQLLDINLKMLNTAYMVRITNQNTGEVVYEKAVNAGSIVALDIDISEYPKGQYAITIENSYEVFNGVIDTTTGIDEIVNGKSLNSKSIYNLQGLRMKQLQKGFNIIEGKKIFVK